ncbi:proteome of centrioles 1 isoform X2 [Halictus rubicundus]
MIQTGCDPTIERHFKGHENIITSLCFHPETTQLISSSLDKTIMQWNLKESARAYRFLGHKDAVNDVSYAPSGEVIASASRDRSVRIWVPKVTGQSIDFKAHSGAVRSVEFSPDGEKLLTASDDKSIKLWMVCQRRFLTSFLSHTSWVRCAKFSNDGRLIVSCSDDKTTKLWDITSGQCIRTLHDPKAYNTYVEFHPSGSVIGCANMAGSVKLYDSRSTSLYQQYATHTGPVNTIKFHPKGNFMLTASTDSTMKVLDLLEGRPIYTLKGHANGTSVTSIAFSSNGEYFASGGADRQLLMWKTNFDRDDVAHKNTRQIISCVKEATTSDKNEKQEMLHDKYDNKELQNNKCRCKGPDLEILNKKVEQNVVDQKAQKFSEQGCITNGSCLSKDLSDAQFSMCSSNIVDALNEQVQSLRDTVITLEQRLTVLEEMLKK